MGPPSNRGWNPLPVIEKEGSAGTKRTVLAVRSSRLPPGTQSTLAASTIPATLFAVQNERHPTHLPHTTPSSDYHHTVSGEGERDAQRRSRMSACVSVHRMRR